VIHPSPHSASKLMNSWIRSQFKRLQLVNIPNSTLKKFMKKKQFLRLRKMDRLPKSKKQKFSLLIIFKTFHLIINLKKFWPRRAFKL